MCFVGFVALRLRVDAVKWFNNALIARCSSYLSCNAYMHVSILMLFPHLFMKNYMFT